MKYFSSFIIDNHIVL